MEGPGRQCCGPGVLARVAHPFFVDGRIGFSPRYFVSFDMM